MRRTRCATGVFLWIAMMTISTVASAEVAELLERGRELQRSFEYTQVVILMDQVLSNESATAAQRLNALEISGVVQLLEGKEDQARARFERLLTLDPGHTIDDPDLPPRVHDFFASVRESIETRTTIDVTVTPSDTLSASGLLAFEISLSGTTEGVAEALLYHRSRGQIDYERISLEGSGTRYSGELEVSDVENALEYYVELRAPSGYILARTESANVPTQFRTVAELDGEEEASALRSETARRPWYRTWWFWTVVGVVVVGGATTGIVLATLPEDQQNGSLGTVQMP